MSVVNNLWSWKSHSVPWNPILMNSKGKKNKWCITKWSVLCTRKYHNRVTKAIPSFGRRCVTFLSDCSDQVLRDYTWVIRNSWGQAVLNLISYVTFKWRHSIYISRVDLKLRSIHKYILKCYNSYSCMITCDPTPVFSNAFVMECT